MNDKLFWNKVDTSSDCWIWMGLKNEHGYGIVSRDGVRYRAHRWAWFLAYGIHPALNLCHTCDNPPCVNPLHLIDATQSFNVRDCINKGRLNTSGLKLQEWSLTISQVLQANRMVQLGHTKQEVADYFGISRTALYSNLARLVA